MRPEGLSNVKNEVHGHYIKAVQWNRWPGPFYPPFLMAFSPHRNSNLCPQLSVSYKVRICNQPLHSVRLQRYHYVLAQASGIIAPSAPSRDTKTFYFALMAPKNLINLNICPARRWDIRALKTMVRELELRRIKVVSRSPMGSEIRFGTSASLWSNFRAAKVRIIIGWYAGLQPDNDAAQTQVASLTGCEVIVAALECI
jgi:hypothetical protein